MNTYPSILPYPPLKMAFMCRHVAFPFVAPFFGDNLIFPLGYAIFTSFRKTIELALSPIARYLQSALPNLNQLSPFLSLPDESHFRSLRTSKFTIPLWKQTFKPFCNPIGYACLTYEGKTYQLCRIHSLLSRICGIYCLTFC